MQIINPVVRFVGNSLTVHANELLGGAVDSIQWRGKEFIVNGAIRGASAQYA